MRTRIHKTKEEKAKTKEEKPEETPSVLLKKLKTKELDKKDKRLVNALILDLSNSEIDEEDEFEITKLAIKYGIIKDIYSNKEKITIAENTDKEMLLLNKRRNEKIGKIKLSFETGLKATFRSFTFTDYENKKNKSALIWLLNIKILLQNNDVMGIQYKHDTSENKIQMKSLSNDTITAIKSARTYGNLMDIFLTFFKKEGTFGYSNEDEEYTIDISYIRIVTYRKKMEQRRYNADTHKYKVKNVGNYELVQVPSKNNNCLIEAFKYLSKSRLDEENQNIKLALNIPLDFGIKPEKAKDLEDYFGIKVKIYTNPFSDNELLYPLYSSKLEKEKERHTIVVWDDHYYPAYNTTGEKEKDEKADETPIKARIFFDFETIWNINTGLLSIYSCFSTYVDNEGNTEEKYFTGRESGKDFVKYLVEKSNRSFITTLVGFNSSRFDNFLLLEELAKMNLITGAGVFVVNGALLRMKFMNYQTLDLCRFTPGRLKDILKNFKCTIKKGDFSHEIPQAAYMKGGWDGLEKWIEENNEKLYEYNKADTNGLKELFDKILIEVKVLDSLITGDIKAYRKECKNKRGITYIKILTPEPVNLEDHMTISGMCYALWVKSLEIREKKIPRGPINEKCAFFIRKTLIAGRAQIFNPGIVYGEIMSLDAKSLYPTVTIRGLPYPSSIEIPTTKEVKDKQGLYKVRINRQPEVNIIPYRTEDEGLDWTYRKPFEVELCSNDIKVLREFGSDIEIIPFNSDECHIYDVIEGTVGFYYEESKCDLFDYYMKPFKDGKTKQDIYKSKDPQKYNPALREMLKIAQNGVLGKLGQREFNKETQFCLSKSEEEKFIKKHFNLSVGIIPQYNCSMLSGGKHSYKYKSEKCKPWKLMVFVYSYAREHMYKALLSKVSFKLATDTDSLHMLKPDFNKLVQTPSYSFSSKLEGGEKRQIIGNFKMGGEYGDFENEITFSSRVGYYVVKKVYGLFSKDYKDEDMFKLEGEAREMYMMKNCKMRFKGISSRDKLLIINQENFNIIGGTFDITKPLLISDSPPSFPNLLGEGLSEKEEKREKNQTIKHRLATPAEQYTLVKKIFLKRFDEATVLQQHKLYEAQTKTLCEEVYMRLTHEEHKIDGYGNEVLLLSSMLDRSLGTSTQVASIRQIFRIKAIHFEHDNLSYNF